VQAVDGPAREPPAFGRLADRAASWFLKDSHVRQDERAPRSDESAPTSTPLCHPVLPPLVDVDGQQLQRIPHSVKPAWGG
jgi:hypothetical protein